MRWLLLLALVLAPLAPEVAEARGRHHKVDVMSQNQYLGADLGDVIAATDPVAFNAALVAALQQISANEFHERIKMLTKLIGWRGPDLLGLQEVFRFECFNIPLPGPDCDDPSIAGAFNDHLTATLAHLSALHKPYALAGVVVNLDLTGVLIPGLPPGLPVDLDFDGNPDLTVTVLDRDVILAKPGVATRLVTFPCSRPSGDGCNYKTVASVVSPIGPIVVERGFVGVDARVRGKHYRFVNTHLEVMELAEPPPGTPPGVVVGGSIQAAQATELNALVAASLLTDPPKPGTKPIIVGDINSSPTDGLFVDPLFPDPTQPLVPPYRQLATGVDLVGVAAPGPWTDAWTQLRFPRPGFTCCQLSDLSNPFSILDERIDVVFSLVEPKRVRRGWVLGSTFFSKTFPSGLWSSDHGQPAVELRFD